MKNWLLVLLCLMSNSADAFQTVFVVRHAEKQDDSRDPPLNLQGKRRALNLASLLRDASVQTIFVSEYQRTQKTAEALADLLNIKPTVMDAKNFEKMVATIQADTSVDSALVIGHSNTVPDLLKALGVPVKWTIADNEYDRLLIVTLIKGAAPVITNLRY